MTKNEFLKGLARALRRMKREEREKSLAFYREMIDDRVEAGLTEDAAVAEMEPIADIAPGILQDAAARGALKKERNPVATVLLILGSPLWASLLAVLFVGLGVVTVCLWTVVACLYCVVGALGAACLGCLACMALLLEFSPFALFFVGAALLCCGLGILVCMLANLTAKGFAHATGGMWRSVCRILFRRRNAA